jgi:two-component system chemotaxis response regulator CheY
VIDAIAAPITVLVVEPSRVQAAIIKGYLEERSHTVVGVVTNGSDAVAAVRSLSPQAVMAAMHLADMNGVELAKQIRSEMKSRAPGFLLVTSESDEGASSSLSKLNRVLLLHKPFTPSQMADALSQVTGASMTLHGKGSSASEVDAAVEKVPRNQMRVLIVDDSATARLNARSVLSELGFNQFTEAIDGAFAIAIAARESFQLIVTDYNMPLMDGRALISYFKQNPTTAAIPIIMVTTETDPRILDPVRKLGVIAIVEKSFPVKVVGPLLDSLF